MSKETAIEWLIGELNGYDEDCEIFQIAKAMEREQMKESFVDGHSLCRCVTDSTDEAKECFDEWFEQFKKTKGGEQ